MKKKNIYIFLTKQHFAKLLKRSKEKEKENRNVNTDSKYK